MKLILILSFLLISQSSLATPCTCHVAKGSIPCLRKCPIFTDSIPKIKSKKK